MKYWSNKASPDILTFLSKTGKFNRNFIMEKIKKDSLSRKIRIKNLLGIHVKPAAKIAAIAKNAQQEVWILKQNNKAGKAVNTKKVDASSIIDILSIGGSNGTQIIIKVETSKDIDILNSLCDLIESRFGEEK